MRPSWYLSNAFVGAWPRPIIHRQSSTKSPSRPCGRLAKLYACATLDNSDLEKNVRVTLEIKNPRVRSRIVDVNLSAWWLRSARFRARSRVRTPPCLSELFARSANACLGGHRFEPGDRKTLFSTFSFSLVCMPGRRPLQSPN